jgi:hypothetical protein
MISKKKMAAGMQPRDGQRKFVGGTVILRNAIRRNLVAVGDGDDAHPIH